MSKSWSVISITSLLVLLALCSCKGGSTNAVSGGDTLSLKYATQLTVVRYADYTVATVADPWHEGKTLHTYLLVPADKDVPADLPEGTVIRTPLSRAVVFTTVHSSLLISLGAENCIKGVCDLRYIDIPWIQTQCRAGHVADCGSGMSPDIEKIIDTKPGALLLSPFENSGGYGKLEEIGVPIVECADYMEPTALGRAEWMKFFGLLTGREHEADSIFTVVEDNYMRLKTIAGKTVKRPSVVVDKKEGAVWYVPGGQSTIGRLIADAGGRYAFAAIDKSGSVSMPFESVLDKAGQSDIWLFRYSSDHPITYAELAAEYGGYREMKAFKTRQTYGCNVSRTRFYEESPFRPDLLLGDFVAMLHPETGCKMRYFQRVEE